MININKFETTERPECNKDTKLFFDDVCTNSTRTKKAQVETAQCGRSMIEMLGVLAIVGVLSVGGIAGYSKAMEKFKINKTADQISQIVTNIRTLYAQQTTYDGLNTATAIQMGVTPDEMGTGTTLTNPFAGNVEIYEAHKRMQSEIPDTYNAFYILYSGLPKEACVTLSTMDWGNTSSSGLLGLCLSGGCSTSTMLSLSWNMNSVYNGGAYLGGQHLPLSVATAASTCSSCGNNCTFGLKFF